MTVAGISPGSANVICGQVAAVKLRGDNIQDMVIKAPAAMKMAVGENPKRVYGEKGKSPKTRMAIAAILRKNLTNAQRYAAKKARGEDVYDPELEALIPVVNGEIPVHIHAHEADDIQTAIRIAREFGLDYSIIHATGAKHVAAEMAAEGKIPVIGPASTWVGKMEMRDVSFDLGAILNAAGIEVAITTDHDVRPLWLLPVYASLYVREGMPEDAALKAITINGAKALGIDHRVGSIRPGKDADIVVFSGHPFHYLTKPTAVFIDGVRY